MSEPAGHRRPNILLVMTDQLQVSATVRVG